MLIASQEIEVVVPGFLVSPEVIVVAVLVWLLIATGTVGRVAHYIEELSHLRATEARLDLSRTATAFDRASATWRPGQPADPHRAPI